MKRLNNLMDHILYQIFKIILNIYLKTWEKTVNPSIRIFVNKIENRIASKMKAGYYFGLLTPETIKLLGKNKRKITKNEICKNIPHLEITEVVFVHFNIVNKNYKQNLRAL